MVQSLVDYVKKEVAEGYSIPQIKTALLKYGYPKHQIDVAIKQYYAQLNKKGRIQKTKTIRPRFKINKKIIFIAGTIILITILIFASINVIEKINKEPEINFEFDSIITTIKQGDTISFLKKSASSEEITASFSFQLLDENNNVILNEYETLQIKDSISSRTDILTSENLTIGTYSLKIKTTYLDKEEIDYLTIKVYEESISPTCFDNIQNQGETEIDCGGPCQVCSSCPINCNDNDACTFDYCNESSNYECKYVLIEDCGQGIAGLPKEPLIDELPSGNTLRDIRQQLYDTISSDPIGAGQLCNSLSIVLEKDVCFKTVAELSNSSNFCGYVVAQLTKDSCYMKFVINNFEFSHCDIIQDSYLKDSCLSIKRLKEMEAEYNQQE